jgi:Fic/DOC family protein
MGDANDRPDAEALLRRTPYLISDGPDARERFSNVASRARTIGISAVAAAQSIAEQARHVLPQFELAVTSDLVSESNRLEGIESSSRDIRDLARMKGELLQMEVGAFIQFLRDDPRVLESLGLFRAYVIADEWARSDQRPREFELRQLHALVMPTLDSAGAYKSSPNEIGGSTHVPTPPWDVRGEMAELADWFGAGTGDAVLDAAVAHAWLTHIHPFDDGNGRMARLLANLALVQARYPPLLLRSGSDRGQYLDALAASDDGDILPLYDLFVKSLRRVVKTMAKPGYVEFKIRDELLATVSQRHGTWRALTHTFFTCLEQKAARAGWRAELMGYPEIENFELLESRSADGNCWFAKLRYRGAAEWLLWFGYRSDVMTDLLGASRPWPSVFFGQRTDDPRAVHPFEDRFDSDGLRPGEICLSPGRQRPVTLRWEHSTEDLRIDEAADKVIRSVCR